jgi:DNA repair exonuclease SbcCD nuclease subunit
MKFVVTADWHLRATKPRCRMDEDWYKTQENALEQIREFANEKRCPIFVVGDIFHSIGDTSFYCIQMVQKMARRTREGLYILAGNHDLPYHSTENIEKSAIGILMRSNKIKKIKDYFIENDFDDFSAGNFDEKTEDAEIIFKHVLCFPDMKSLPPNVDAMTAKDLLEEYPKSKWIFTGDMHKNFHYEKNGRHVVNPGCLLRQAVDFKDYQPGFYFVDTEKNIVEFNLIIDSEAFVDDSYILREKEKEERIEAFANKIGEVENVSLDYSENVKKTIIESELSDELIETIEELMGV